MLFLIRIFVGIVILAVIWQSSPTGAIVVAAGLGIVVWVYYSRFANRVKAVRQAQAAARHEAELPQQSGFNQRTGTYRGASRKDAEHAYHIAARLAARDGFVPRSEDWSGVLGQEVLTVVYTYDPKQAPAVLAAIAEAEPGLPQ